jgi:predicted DNA-binding transcriptional regulator AlpA
MMAVANDDDTEQLVSVETIARRFDVSPDTVRNMVRDQRFIPPLYIGKLPRWRERDVNAWIAARAVKLKKIEASAEKSLAPQKRRG